MIEIFEEFGNLNRHHKWYILITRKCRNRQLKSTIKVYSQFTRDNLIPLDLHVNKPITAWRIYNRMKQKFGAGCLGNVYNINI